MNHHFCGPTRMSSFGTLPSSLMSSPEEACSTSRPSWIRISWLSFLNGHKRVSIGDYGLACRYAQNSIIDCRATLLAQPGQD
ncbi:hypothetical protein MY4824_007694 [Beauveria thailandica]